MAQMTPYYASLNNDESEFYSQNKKPGPIEIEPGF
jgi:hypothetical protein